MAEPAELREKAKRQREWLAAAFLALLFGVLTFAEFRLTKISSSLPFVNSIFFFGLVNINVLILTALVWLVFRNIGKLWIERRRKVLGARLKTKLVIAFLAFSIIPTLMLFLISALYINSSFDKWFSVKIQNTLEATLEITNVYYKSAERTAAHFAEHLASKVGAQRGGRTPKLQAWLSEQRELLALDGIELYFGPLEERLVAERPALTRDGVHVPRLALDALDNVWGRKPHSAIEHVGSGDLIRYVVPLSQEGEKDPWGAIAVSTYIPVSLVNRVDEISSVFDDYRGTNPLKYPVKTAYFMILVMMTLVIIFVAIWIGLLMAREMTVPLERLVNGARAVGAGNLSVSIPPLGNDEISVLIESFNKMTQALREGRQQLEKRRAQLETVLTNVATGVFVADSDGVILQINRAMSEMIGVPEGDLVGRHMDEAFGGDQAFLARLVRQAVHSPGARQEDAQHTLRGDRESRSVLAHAVPLVESPGARPWGVVVAVDDVTLINKSQREMAWREVARRIAHEIKNPLTPIKLSAQRLQKRLSNLTGKEGALLRECTDTIVQHTDELKQMVNEFSNFARLPEVNPIPNDLNSAVQEVATLYQQAHADIFFITILDDQLPAFEFDRDQIKRVLINLLDNSVTALAQNPLSKRKKVEILTHYNAELKRAVLEVRDTGPGMEDALRERVFEPYFSTKAQGTGLGLAIAKRIISDHQGYIRVLSEVGVGTQFLVEIPASEIRNGATQHL